MKPNELTASLNRYLADAAVFARKAKHYHWNVRGRDFFTLHAEFEKLYASWSAWIDAVAERIVALGGQPLATHAAELKAARLAEDAERPSAEVMVRRTLDDLKHLASETEKLIDSAEGAGDRTTANLLDDVHDGIEASAWMLRAFLDERA